MDKEKEIKHEMWKTTEEIKYQKKKLIMLKQQLLNLQGEKRLDNEMKLRKKKK